jgi:predicted RNase H-like HicB family nuclease
MSKPKPQLGKQFTVSDGELVLTLTVAEDGWYAVESPLDPSLITQGKTIEECFYMAYDALEGLREVRKEYREAISKAMTAPAA